MIIQANAAIESKHLDGHKLIALFDKQVVDKPTPAFAMAIEPEENFWCYVDLTFGQAFIHHGLVAVYAKSSPPPDFAPCADAGAAEIGA